MSDHIDDVLHYSDNESDTYCDIDLDDRLVMWTDDPDAGVTCLRCIDEMDNDKIGVNRRRETLASAGLV